MANCPLNEPPDQDEYLQSTRPRSTHHHMHRLAQTGTSANNRQELQVNDARACWLVISHRNVIIDCARNAGAEHKLTPALAYCTDHHSRVITKTIRGLPHNERKRNSGPWTRYYTPMCIAKDKPIAPRIINVELHHAWINY